MAKVFTIFRSEALPNHLFSYKKKNSIFLILMSAYLSVNTCFILGLIVAHESAISYHCNAIMKLSKLFFWITVKSSSL